MSRTALDAGAVYLDVLPELKDFGRRLRSQLEPEFRRVNGAIPIEPGTKNFGRDLRRDTEPHIDRVADHAESKLGGAFRRIAGLAAGIFAAKLGVDAFKGVIDSASDLNETVSKSRTIFGQAGAEMEKWASGAAKAFGQSKQGALDAAATFGNLFVQLGSGTGEAAKMSRQMVELASDFASFHNADPSDVITSMTAAFRGEYDAVQRYVPTITAATVEQQALKMGLAGSTKELTAQDKALATQALLMEGAGAAMGDFARTSDGLANRQRILSAQYEDVRARIGTALMPIVLALMERFLQFGQALSGPVKAAFDLLRTGFEAMVSSFRDPDITSDGFVGVMEQIGAAARGVVDFITQSFLPGLLAGIRGEGIPDASPAQQIFESLGSAIRAVSEFVRDNFIPIMGAAGTLVATKFAVDIGTAVASMAQMIISSGGVGSALTALAGGPVVLIIAAIGAAVAALVALYLKNETFRDFVQDAWAKISGFISEAWTGVIQPTWSAISGFITGTLIPTAQNLWQVTQDVWDGITTVVSFAWDNVLEPTWQLMKLGMEFLAAAAQDLFEIWVNVVWKPLAAAVEAAWSIVEPIWNRMKDILENAIVPALQLVGRVSAEVWDTFVSTARTAWNAIEPIISGALRVIGNLVNGFLRVVANIADVVGLDHVAGVLREAADAAGGWGQGGGGPDVGPNPLGGDLSPRLAAGGLTETGSITNGPRAIVGEGKSQWPEYVLATDPTYRQRNKGLWVDYGRRTGMFDDVPGFQLGGIIDAVKEVAGDVAGAVRRLGAGALSKVWPKLDVPDNLGGIPPAAFNTIREAALRVIGGKADEVKRAADEAAARRRSGGGGAILGYGYQALIDYLGAVGVANEVTSTVRPGDPGRHGEGLAADFVSGNMSEIGDAFMNISDAMYELIHNPGYSVKEGREVGADFWGAETWEAHGNHVHGATNRDESEGPPIYVPGSGSGGDYGGDCVSWVREAADAEGVPEWTDALHRRAMFESSCNPNAQNNWDSNAEAGDPSRGLMQTIGATFDAYADSGWDIWNPVHNTRAAIRYIKARYGDISEIDPPTSGYKMGGILTTELGSMLPAGLIEGLAAEDARLRVALRGMAGTITGTVTDALQIHSPSQVFYGYGVDVMQGFIDGIEDWTGPAEDVMRQFIEAIRTQFETLLDMLRVQYAAVNDVLAPDGAASGAADGGGPQYLGTPEEFGPLYGDPTNTRGVGQIVSAEDDPRWLEVYSYRPMNDGAGNYWVETSEGGRAYSEDWIRSANFYEYHDGGWVTGAWGQDVPALLQAGEYVLSRDDVSNVRAAEGIDYDRLARALARALDGTALMVDRKVFATLAADGLQEHALSRS